MSQRGIQVGLARTATSPNGRGSCILEERGDMEVPKEYHSREQSFLKHRVLREYLDRWSHKIGSLAGRGPVKLWYVDCFAGPWRHQDERLHDTSIHIGLEALEEAARSWQPRGHKVELGAIFVEKDASSFRELQKYIDQRESLVDIEAIHGEFGACVPRIAACLGNDPAFIFVDPTGFKGVAMSFIARLMEKRMRDVLVNVMFNHINRFKDEPQQFLRAQMRDFFGLGTGDLPEALAETELMALYRRNLKQRCKIRYAADLAIPHPTRERTWFRLVIGGNHHEVLNVFRKVERTVAGEEASVVRSRAKRRAEEERSGQLGLDLLAAPTMERAYENQNQRDCESALHRVREELVRYGRRTFVELWPRLLEDLHITRRDLIARLLTQADLIIEPHQSPRRTIKDQDWIALGERS